MLNFRTFALSLLFTAAAAAQSLTGAWDCTVTVGANQIPFRMEFTSVGGSVTGNFFNGEERVPSTAGHLRDGELKLAFDQYATTLEAKLTSGALSGRLDGPYRNDSRWYDFHP